MVCLKMKNAAMAIMITEMVFIVKETAIGRASFFRAGRSAENRMRGMATHTSTDEKSDARAISAPQAFIGKLNTRPSK